MSDTTAPWDNEETESTVYNEHSSKSYLDSKDEEPSSINVTISTDAVQNKNIKYGTGKPMRIIIEADIKKENGKNITEQN